MSERLMLEREDVLSHFARVKFDEQQVREWCKKECQAEVERLSLYVSAVYACVLGSSTPWFARRCP